MRHATRVARRMSDRPKTPPPPAMVERNTEPLAVTEFEREDPSALSRPLPEWARMKLELKMSVETVQMALQRIAALEARVDRLTEELLELVRTVVNPRRPK